MLFVTLGYEHSIANMFFIPAAIYTGAEITWGAFILQNLIPPRWATSSAAWGWWDWSTDIFIWVSVISSQRCGYISLRQQAEVLEIYPQPNSKRFTTSNIKL